MGGGPAAMTAAVYLARKNIRLIVVSKDIGGQVNWTSAVENYMGFRMVEGSDLMAKFHSQMSELKVPVNENETVVSAAGENDNFIVTAESGKKYLSKTILIATGKKPRPLNVPGEKKLVGRGVAYCATCDAPLFRDAEVAVVGGGNSALASVSDLISYASKIYLFNDTEKLTADAVMADKAEKSGKVEVFNSSRVTEIRGEKSVEGISAEISGVKRKFSVRGIFIEIGLVPNTQFIGSFLKLNKQGEIMINSRNETDIRGVFAAGDVTDVPEKQIIVAAGEGAKAALSLTRHLNSIRLP